MKKWFNVIVYLSLIFLVYKLYQANYLKIPHIYNIYYLVISIILLCFGMVANTVTWSRVLKVYGYPVTYSKGLIAVGLAIFTKYIPGKILMILGRAEYISQEYGLPRKTTSSLSLITQLISIWSGLTFGILGIILIGEVEIRITIISVVFWLLSVGLIFTPILYTLSDWLAKILGKQNFELPRLRFKQTISVVPFFLINWGAWCLSFYFLCLALTTGIKITIVMGLAFALGGTIGIISIITPGGIGVREGVIASFLMITNLTPVEATTIAVSSRLWFLFGEVFIFLLSFIISRKCFKL